MTTVRTADQPDQFALVNTAITARWQRLDSDGEPSDTGAAPTVACADAAGNAVTIGSVSADPTTVGGYTATIAAADNDSITELTATWTESGLAHTTTIAVIGAWPFSVDQLRTFDRSVVSAPTATLLTARSVTIAELQGIAPRKSPVPRYASADTTASQGGWLLLPHADVRSIVSVYDVDPDGTTDAWSDTERAYLHINGSIIHNRAGAFTDAHLRVDYTYGLDRPPHYLREAMMLRCVWWATREASTLMERTTSWSTGEGGTYRYDMASVDKTGMPNVDAAYLRWRGGEFAIA